MNDFEALFLRWMTVLSFGSAVLWATAFAVVLFRVPTVVDE